MYAQRFLHKLLAPVIHLRRLSVLTMGVLTLIKTKRLQLTALGRGLEQPIQERSRIRKMDRLFGNKHLQKESTVIYEAVTKLLVGSKKRPIIIVDWTKLPHCNYYVLRASLATEGRALTLYEEMHPKEKESNRKVHETFLKKLKKLLPVHCTPIIVTDAGFKNPWFKQVLALGWDFVGRVRGKMKYSSDGKLFVPCETLHTQAASKIKYLGEKILTRKNPMILSFYLVKEKLKGRKKLTKKGTISKHKDSINYGRAHREPWLLVSSLQGTGVASKVYKTYKKRMAIEEAFRDLKSTRYGFSLSDSKTVKKDRYIVLLLIALLGSLIAYLTGKAVEMEKLHYQYQANSTKNRRVLSYFYLGCQVLKDMNRNLSLTVSNLINTCQTLEADYEML
jgi:hypothetical protein